MATLISEKYSPRASKIYASALTKVNALQARAVAISISALDAGSLDMGFTSAGTKTDKEGPERPIKMTMDQMHPNNVIIAYLWFC